MVTPGSVRKTTPAMRKLLVAASVLVLIIGAPLFILPTETETLFSWSVNPPLTAAFLGAAYWAAFVLEYLCSRESEWARARVAVPAVLLFTTLTLIVTLVHIDKFHFDADPGSITWVITWVWLIVYAVVPLIMATILVVQMRTPGAEPVRVSPMPSWMHIVLISQTAVMLLLGVSLLVAPTSVAPSVWPWGLSALTGRAIGAWLLGLGLAAAHASRENDLVRVEGAMAACLAFGALELGALFRFATALHPVTGNAVVDWTDLRAWLYLAFMLSIAVVGLLGWLGAREAKQSVQAEVA